MVFSWRPEAPRGVEKNKDIKRGGILVNTITALSNTLGISRAWPCIVAVWRRFIENT